MSFTKTKINSVEVKPFKNSVRVDDRPVLGYELFPEVYGQIFICARKKSGKSTLIQTILKKCCSKQTNLIVFCTTIHKDEAWIGISRWAKKNNINFQGFSEIKDGRDDILSDFLDANAELEEDEDVKSESEEEEEKQVRGRRSRLFDQEQKKKEDEPYDEEEDEHQNLLFGNMSEKAHKLFSSFNKETSKKEKFKAPKYIIIFDDMSHQLKLPSVQRLMKLNRHLKCKVIVSSQWPLDLLPAQLKQMDYFLLLGKMSDEKLEQLRERSGLALDFEMLKELYDDATKEQYGFLYIDANQEQYRSKFNTLYQLC